MTSFENYYNDICNARRKREARKCSTCGQEDDTWYDRTSGTWRCHGLACNGGSATAREDKDGRSGEQKAEASGTPEILEDKTQATTSQEKRATCTADGCNEPRHTRVLCVRHYNVLFFGYDPEAQLALSRTRREEERREKEKATCTGNGCTQPAVLWGLCRVHNELLYPQAPSVTGAWRRPVAAASSPQQEEPDKAAGTGEDRALHSMIDAADKRAGDSTFTLSLGALAASAVPGTGEQLTTLGHARWMTARSLFLRTGDPGDLEAMLACVTMDTPVLACDVPAARPVRGRTVPRARRVLAQVGPCLAITLVVLLYILVIIAG
jgi:hypothetical protein